jgi:hypothetical protein
MVSTAVSSLHATNFLCRFRKRCLSWRVGNYSYTNGEPDLQALRFSIVLSANAFCRMGISLSLQFSVFECDNNGDGTELYTMRPVRSRYFRINDLHGTEKIIVSYLVKRYSVFYETENFFSVITRDYHWTATWVKFYQLTLSLRSILMLS